MGSEIANTFANINLAPLVLLIVGMIFIYIEEFIPGFGFFGIVGIVLSVLAIILRVLQGDGDPIIQIFTLVIFQAILTGLGLTLVVVLSKLGILNKSWLVQNNTAVAPDFSAGTQNYNHLIGLEGIVVTDLRPIGKAKFGDDVYDVETNSMYVETGNKVIVKSVEGFKVIVKKIE